MGVFLSLFFSFLDPVTIILEPKDVIGISSTLFFLTKHFFLLFMFPDILITEASKPEAVLNPFSLLNKNFINHIHGRKNCFLTDITSVKETTENIPTTLYSMTVTLLPFQVLFIPAIYEKMIVPSPAIEAMKKYTDEDIRY